ncbi:MAG: hypothetical protein RLY95_1126 [Pseudomonadota bacterium]|jgi:hypothetical protein
MLEIFLWTLIPLFIITDGWWPLIPLMLLIMLISKTVEFCFLMFHVFIMRPLIFLSRLQFVLTDLERNRAPSSDAVIFSIALPKWLAKRWGDRLIARNTDRNKINL